MFELDVEQVDELRCQMRPALFTKLRVNVVGLWSFPAHLRQGLRLLCGVDVL